MKSSGGAELGSSKRRLDTLHASPLPKSDRGERLPPEQCLSLPWPSLLFFGSRPGAGGASLAQTTLQAAIQEGMRVAAVTVEDARGLELQTRSFAAGSDAQRLLEAGASSVVRVRGPADRRKETVEAMARFELDADAVVLVGAPALAVASPWLSVLVTGCSPWRAWDAVPRGVAERADLQIASGTAAVAEAVAHWLAQRAASSAG